MSDFTPPPQTAPLAFELRGPLDGEPLVLIPGLGSQLLFWPEAFCQFLEAQGFRLILLDNRDCGLSPRTPGEPPSVAALLDGARGRLAYTLDDMAVDVMLLLDHLGIHEAHLLGNSMGGMIAQTVALAFGHRIRSLTSLLSAPGTGWVVRDREALARSMTDEVDDPDAYVASQLEGYRSFSGPHFDEAGIRDMLERCCRRAFHPRGRSFQMQAMLASPDRTERLRELHVPTLVIHGRLDPIAPLAAAEATANAISGARLLVFDDMGHDLSPPHWKPVAAAVAALARGESWESP